MNKQIEPFERLKPIIHTLPACLVWIAFACSVGVLITSILKKLPILKKFI